jgi:hypothetical protein
MSETDDTLSGQVSITATADCHDNVWHLTERVGSGPTRRLSFPYYLTYLKVAGFVPLAPGWLPAVLVQTADGTPTFEYHLVADHDSRLTILQLPGPGWGVMQSGARTQYRDGFSCALTPTGDLQLNLYQVTLNFVPKPRYASIAIVRYGFTARGRFRLEGMTVTRGPLSTAPIFDAVLC